MSRRLQQIVPGWTTLVAGLALGAILAVAGCSEESQVRPAAAGQPSPTAPAGAADGGLRWFSSAQAAQGKQVFSQHCAACHGDQAEGLTRDWRKRQADGSFPPPPLNGSAHAWHHPLQQLLQVIDTGGIPYGGQMPPFEDVLDDSDKRAAIAYFQSFWSEEIYLAWLDRGGID